MKVRGRVPFTASWQNRKTWWRSLHLPTEKKNMLQPCYEDTSSPCVVISFRNGNIELRSTALQGIPFNLLNVIARHIALSWKIHYYSYNLEVQKFYWSSKHTLRWVTVWTEHQLRVHYTAQKLPLRIFPLALPSQEYRLYSYLKQ